MRRVSGAFLLAISPFMQGDMPESSRGYHYPRVPELTSYGYYYHTVRPGESLSTIAWGTYGYMEPMVAAEINMDRTTFIQALTEYLALNNDISSMAIHKLKVGQKLFMPPLDPETCATLLVREDWRKLDDEMKLPLRPRARPMLFE